MGPASTCWQRRRADRLRFLVDGAEYFQVLAQALRAARRRVLILAWDVHSRIPLVPQRSARDGQLVDFLNAAAARGVEVLVLDWDYSMLYAFDREMLPEYHLAWRTHPGVRFHRDANHVVGASLHHKVVVIDGQLAFAGGIDLTVGRWDTREHAPQDPLRVDVSGAAYEPTHDVQVMLEGPAVECLDELARERWQRSTGERVEALPRGASSWPANLPAHLERVTVGFARTEASFAGRPALREVERSYGELIGAARRSLYIENQYLTSEWIGDLLGRRLAELEGPDIVIVGPRECPRWMEEQTMGALRARVLARLRAADCHGRLRLLYPAVGDARLPVAVHSKLAVADDEVARVGSANLSNRSLALDSEIDLWVEANGDDAVRAAIRRFRDDLIAEHVGAADAATVARAIEAEGSLARAVDRLSGEGRPDRVLLPIPDVPGDASPMPLPEVYDPQRPAELEHVTEVFRHGASSRWSSPLARVALGGALLAGLWAAWRFTPLHEWLDADLVQRALEVRDVSWAPAVAVLLLVVGSVVMMPMTVLVLAVAAVLGPWRGFLCSLTGTFLGALLGYGLGRRLLHDLVQRAMGRRGAEIQKLLVGRSVLTVFALRLVPVAPFLVINLAAGSSRIRLRDFALGSLLAMVPGTLALSWLGDSLVAGWLRPSWTTILPVLLIALFFVLVGLATHRLMRRAPPLPEDGS